jgi:hypothetical protein
MLKEDLRALILVLFTPFAHKSVASLVVDVGDHVRRHLALLEAGDVSARTNQSVSVGIISGRVRAYSSRTSGTVYEEHCFTLGALDAFAGEHGFAILAQSVRSQARD